MYAYCDSIWLEALGNDRDHGPLTTLTCSVSRDDAALTQQMTQWMEHWQNDTDRGRPQCSAEHLSLCHSLHHKFHMHLRGKRPAWRKVRNTHCAHTHAPTSADSLNVLCVVGDSTFCTDQE
jgi:hypothetical protein